MERLKQRQSTVQTTSGRFQPVSIPTARTAADNADTPNFALKEAIDKFLIADFFFVVFALVSLGVSLAVNLAFESSVSGCILCSYKCSLDDLLLVLFFTTKLLICIKLVSMLILEGMLVKLTLFIWSN